MCLLVALGGTSTAQQAVGSAKRLITGEQVKDGSLSGADVRNSSLDGRDIRTGGIQIGDLAPGARPNTSGAGKVGPQGPKGATGPEGAKGAAGEPGANGVAGADGPKGDPGAVGPRGPTGLTGAKGDKGDTGTTGADGPPGMSGYVRLASAPIANPGGARTVGHIDCTGSQKPVAGGASGSSGITDQHLGSSFPTANGWTVNMDNTGVTDRTFTVYVVCVTVE
jgi:hypothetical protein